MTASPPSSSSSASQNAVTQFASLRNGTITLTSKTMSYFLPIQLALSQFPSSILPAAVGWAVGYAYRNEVLPATNWRVPAWVVGQKNKGPNMESLRRRLEGEEAETGNSTARELDEGGSEEGGQRIRGRLAQLLGEQFFGGRGR
jgi:hypothetical protein